MIIFDSLYIDSCWLAEISVTFNSIKRQLSLDIFRHDVLSGVTLIHLSNGKNDSAVPVAVGNAREVKEFEGTPVP